MKHLTLLVPKVQNNLIRIICTYKVFKKANEYQKRVGKKEVFKIELAGLSKHVSFHDGLFSVKPHALFSAIKKTDFIIIPAIGKDFTNILAANKPLIPWI